MNSNWAIISIISRFTAVGIGLIQSLVIASLLTEGDFGLRALAFSVVAAVGVYQNLGISSGSTREIAGTRNINDAFKVFLGSLLARYSISLPLSLLLFFAANKIGNEYYGKPEIVTPLKILAIVLLIQGAQSVLGSVIQGLKRFKFLFLFQASIAIISICIHIPLLIYKGFIGSFYAHLALQVVWTTILLIYTLNIFKGSYAIPSKKELFTTFRAVFAIGLFVYFIKILTIQWQKLGELLIGNKVDAYTLGVFAFAVLIASKISIVSDAITDITLPSMTEVYEKNKRLFQKVFLDGNSKALVLITLTTIFVIFFKYDIFKIIDTVIALLNFTNKPLTEKFADSFVYIDSLAIAFWAYSQMDLLKSGLSIPSKKLIAPLIGFTILFITTIVSFYILPYDYLTNITFAVTIGGLLGYITTLLSIKEQIGFFPMTLKDFKFITITLFCLVLYYYLFSNIFIAKCALFFIYSSISLLLYNLINGKLHKTPNEQQVSYTDIDIDNMP